MSLARIILLGLPNLHCVAECNCTQASFQVRTCKSRDISSFSRRAAELEPKLLLQTRQLPFTAFWWSGSARHGDQLPRKQNQTQCWRIVQSRKMLIHSKFSTYWSSLWHESANIKDKDARPGKDNLSLSLLLLSVRDTLLIIQLVDGVFVCMCSYKSHKLSYPPILWSSSFVDNLEMTIRCFWALTQNHFTTPSLQIHLCVFCHFVHDSGPSEDTAAPGFDFSPLSLSLHFFFALPRFALTAVSFSFFHLLHSMQEPFKAKAPSGSPFLYHNPPPPFTLHHSLPSVSLCRVDSFKGGALWHLTFVSRYKTLVYLCSHSNPINL